MQAELVWANCGTELMHLIEAFQDLESSSNHDTLLEHDEILKSLALQDLHIKKTISDCLSVKNVDFPESGEENIPKKLYVEYLEYFQPGSNYARRNRRLADVGAPALSPGFSPGPSPLPAEGPSIEKPPSAPFFPVLPTDPNSGKDAQAPSGSGANQQSNNGNNGNNDSHRKIIIAVVVTATTTFLLATLFFCCYMRNCGKRRGQNDERPLLSLSMSDYSMNGMYIDSFVIYISLLKFMFGCFWY